MRIMPLAVLLLATMPCLAAADDASTQLQKALDAIQAFRDREDPMEAIAKGRPADATRIQDRSMAAIERRQKETAQLLAALKAVDRAALTESERLDTELIERELSMDLEGHRFAGYLLVLGPLGGPQQSVPQMVEQMPFARADDLRNHLARLTMVPQALRNERALLEEGLRRGITPPKAILAGVPTQFDAVIAGKLQALREPFERTYPDLSPEQAAQLKAQGNAAVDAVLAEFALLRDFVRDTYVPKARESIACIELPQGRDWYAFALRNQTTTDLAPQAIHDIGLSEVKRIRAEMLQVIRRTDWFAADPARATMPDDDLFAAFVKYLRTDPRFYFTKADELMAGYRDMAKRIDAHLPALFGRLPQLPYGVREIPRFMAPSQTTAYYQSGNMKAGNPGWFYANTYALDQRPKYEMVPLTLHEAVPGHHLQISLAQEMPAKHPLRRDMGFNAFVEGWGLYSERLGIEMGLYKDPYDDFGRLLYEMWRSNRLVVDTGMHALGWTRQQAIDFMKRNTALSELNIEREVDRYIGWPGQACGYKLGELCIRRLRTEAEQRLGAAFDLRAFHDAVLGEGALPLSVLEARMKRWIDAQATAR
ncbi:MAG: DUF885 domain-containing protein [Phycisphaerales bacterium]